MAEGTFAPAIVSQKTVIKISSITGNPVHGPVRSRSRVRSIVRLARARVVPPAAAAISSALRYTTATMLS